MGDILNYFIKKSDKQKNEYFNYRQKTSCEKKTSPEIKFSEELVFDKYIVFDFETTGLSPSKNKIVEIGAVKVKNNKIINKFDTLVNPNAFIPPYIEEKINITNDMVADKPYIEDIMPDFISFLEDYTLIAHNAKFDMSFLIINAGQQGFDIKNNVLDTLRLSRKAFPEYKSHSLGSLCSALGIDLTSAHRAYYDALATYEVYKIICSKIAK